MNINRKSSVTEKSKFDTWSDNHLTFNKIRRNLLYCPVGTIARCYKLKDNIL
jgi:hypothetical protein